MSNAEGERKSLDAVVVGGGQAGLSVSFFLKRHGVDHVVLEKDVAFSAWVNRWDGFVTNTPAWMNRLPMLDRLAIEDGDGFATREEMLAYLDQCSLAVDAPIVKAAARRVVFRGPHRWEVETADTTYVAPWVVMCTGAMSRPRLPAVAADLPADIPQLHSSEYRRPAQITTPRVLVVGSGSSGVQICRLLGESGRFEQIHMATSRVMVLPRRIAGVPVHRLIAAFGLFDVGVDSRLGRLMFSSLETRGDPIVPPTPKELARRHGVQLHPRLVDWDGEHLRFGDGTDISADSLTIVWATGFQGDFGLVDTGPGSPGFDERGFPRHARGVVGDAPGLCYVGLRYQHTVASHDIYGVGTDAEYIARQVSTVLRSQRDDVVHG